MSTQASTPVTDTRPVPVFIGAESDSAPGGRDHARERYASPGHIPALDGIRGVAIIMVVLCHWSQSVITMPIHGVLKDFAINMAFAGQTGVDLFFVLSGFLITRILIAAKGQKSGIRNFLARRALRIFPLYYLLVAVVVFALPPLFRHEMLRMSPSDEELGWLWFYGGNIFNVMHHTWMYGALDHFWSLCVEEHFYLLWPFAVLFLGRRNIGLATAAMLLFSLTARFWYWFGAHDPFACDLLTWCRMDGLACGALLAVAESAGKLDRRLTPFLSALFIGGAVFATGVHHGMFLPYGEVLLKTAESLAFCGLVGLAVVYRDALIGKVLAHPVLTFFGLYSYGLYVYHHLFRPPLLPVNILFPITRANNAAIGYGLVHLAIAVGVAVLSYHLYEKHFLKLKSFFPCRPRCQ